MCFYDVRHFNRLSLFAARRRIDPERRLTSCARSRDIRPSRAIGLIKSDRRRPPITVRRVIADAPSRRPIPRENESFLPRRAIGTSCPRARNSRGVDTGIKGTSQSKLGEYLLARANRTIETNNLFINSISNSGFRLESFISSTRIRLVWHALGVERGRSPCSTTNKHICSSSRVRDALGKHASIYRLLSLPRSR